MENVTIIGSGCAGWTAAIYTARANLQPLLLTGLQPGGLLTTTTVVENFPGFSRGVDGIALMQEMQQQAERFGARIRYGTTVESVDFSQRPFRIAADGETFESRSVIVATDAGHRHLSIPGEAQLENRGVTFCATCDGALPLFRSKPVVVVGGGDSACEEALFLSRFASVVYLVHRRDQLRASPIMASRVLAHDRIKPVWNSVMKEILDVSKDEVTAVRLRDTVTGGERLLDCAGVFIAVGHIPNTQLFRGALDMDSAGYLKLADGTSGTNIEGVFAAGDCADSTYRQAITAAGMGCKAAIDCERWLSHVGSVQNWTVSVH
ncbi:MAG TPA: thioredoxin-disulfide reductase [Chthoniobacter sp.]|jgi:thioredoxin reductase (NADPH)